MKYSLKYKLPAAYSMSPKAMDQLNYKCLITTTTDLNIMKTHQFFQSPKNSINKK